MLQAKRIEEKCTNCGACKDLLPCSGEECAGCGACALLCPSEAIVMEERPPERKVEIEVEGRRVEVDVPATVKRALEQAGYKFSDVPGEGIYSPCGVGGCWSCAVEVDGEVRPACITPVREGMKIKLEFEDPGPFRLVEGFHGHTVGGVGTPWHLKKRGRYIEVACFAAGCNFRCPQCQNWTTTYRGKGVPYTPREAALRMTWARRRFDVDRMAISGGEPTLNRRWLVEYVRELKELNPDPKARIHIDTNGSILTPDYIDELVSAGMTDIGIDLKALRVETFMRITGLKDREKARRYMRTAWRAVEYILKRYGDRVFLGVGIPYNSALISRDEIREMGERLARLDPSLQVCVLDYRPEFRSRIKRPSYEEMRRIHELLRDCGLKTVICQTHLGHIGP